MSSPLLSAAGKLSLSFLQIKNCTRLFLRCALASAAAHSFSSSGCNFHYWYKIKQ